MKYDETPDQEKMSSVILFLVLLNHLILVEAQTGANAKALREKLFVTDKYDKKVRSANDQTDPTEVDVSLHLLQIHELDEVSETLKSTGYLEIYWKDDFLTWTPADYGGLQYSFFPQDDIWKPDVALKNSVVEYKQLGVSTLNVQVTATGEVYWYPYQLFQSSCSVDIKYFPFDIQTCKLKFVAWSYTKAEVVMESDRKGIVLDKFEANSEYDVIDSKSSVEEESGEASIIFSVTIRRKPRYIFLSIIFPIILLTILNIFVFVLPCDSGEKASYAITVFLSFAVFMTIVSSSLPENSDSTSIFSVYIIIQMVQSTLITVLALFLIRLYGLGPERPIPGWLITMVKIISCKCCKNRTSIDPATHDGDEAIHKKDSLIISKVNLANKDTGDSRENLQEDKYDWKRVVTTLDWLFMIIFSVFAFFTTLFCLLLAYVLSKAP